MIAVAGALCLFGIVALGVLATGAIYMLDGLLRQGRYAAFSLALALCCAAFSSAGVWVVSVLSGLLLVGQSAFYCYFALSTLLRSRRDAPALLGAAPLVTLLVAAKDESAVIEGSLRTWAELDYPRGRLELVIVDDGSTDDTAARVSSLAPSLTHDLRVLRHAASGGKARRLNEVVRELDSEFVLILDADHWVEPDLIRRMLARFTRAPDVACVQVASRPRNAPQNFLTKMQAIEYTFRCHGIYPGKPIGLFLGSGGMFRRSAFTAVNGFCEDMLTEDAEISYRLYDAGFCIAYDDHLETHDLAPATLESFISQRRRWMQGLWQAMITHFDVRKPLGRGGFRAHFIQSTLEGVCALCLCVLVAYFALDQFGLARFHALAPINAMLGSCALGFAVGCFRARRLFDLLYLPLIPVYVILHAVPMARALIDSYVLGKPLVWVKTERSAAGVNAHERLREATR